MAVSSSERLRRFFSISWSGSYDVADVVAVVVTQPDGGAAVWYNTRLAYGPVLTYVDLWARYAVMHDRRFDALRRADLARLWPEAG